jgi:hypothetical protein
MFECWEFDRLYELQSGRVAALSGDDGNLVTKSRCQRLIVFVPALGGIDDLTLTLVIHIYRSVVGTGFEFRRFDL